MRISFFSRVCDVQNTDQIVAACVKEGQIPPPGWTPPSESIQSVFSPTTRELKKGTLRESSFRPRPLVEPADGMQISVVFILLERPFIYTLCMKMDSALIGGNPSKIIMTSRRRCTPTSAKLRRLIHMLGTMVRRLKPQHRLVRYPRRTE